MNFRSNNTRRFLKPSSYMLLSLKAVRWDFLVENHLGAGAVRIWSCWSFHPFIIIICVVSSERKILQTAQIRNFEQKEPHHKTGKINLRLFSMYLFIFYVITQFCEPFCESYTFAIKMLMHTKMLMCTQTVCLGSLWSEVGPKKQTR